MTNDVAAADADTAEVVSDDAVELARTLLGLATKLHTLQAEVRRVGEDASTSEQEPPGDSAEDRPASRMHYVEAMIRHLDEFLAEAAQAGEDARALLGRYLSLFGQELSAPAESDASSTPDSD